MLEMPGVLVISQAVDEGRPFLVENKHQRLKGSRGVGIHSLVPSGTGISVLENLEDLLADARDGFAAPAQGQQLHLDAILLVCADGGRSAVARADTVRQARPRR
jgi:hypothetical protein